MLPCPRAQVVDLSTITCASFLQSDQETICLLLMWLADYYTEADEPTVVDFDEMKTSSEQLGKYCAENPSLGLLTAAEKILGEYRSSRKRLRSGAAGGLVEQPHAGEPLRGRPRRVACQAGDAIDLGMSRQMRIA